MNIKNYLIAVDLDGTLVRGFNKHDKKSFRYLKKLSKYNKIVIATGRPLRSSRFYYNLLKLDTPLINYNGALLHKPYDKSFPKKMISIDRNDLFKFLDDNEDIIETVFCEIEDNIYLHKETDFIGPYLHSDGGNMTIGNLKGTLNNNPNGAILFTKIGSEQRMEEYVKREFNGRINLRFWYVNKVVVSEFYSPKTSKANALKIVCDYYNIDHDRTIAIGDGHNDIEMIEFVKYGVAMGKCHPELKEVAKYQTKDVKEHGVYHFLKQFNKQLKRKK
ncbi:MAG: HAD family hydrolase [Bacilli bacterium]